jgi:heme oxygenase
MGPPPLLLDHLRSVTWHRHEAFERLPFVTALMDGTLPLQSYLAQLRGLAVMLSAVSHSMSIITSSASEHLQPLVKKRFELLCADLAFFSERLVPDILPAVQLSLEIARKICTVSYTSPGKLFGYIYVLQGTTKGNQVHLPDVIRCFDLKDHQGASFYRGLGDDTDLSWDEFAAVMNIITGETSLEEALQGAVEMYEALERFHVALYPLPVGSDVFTATALNPEAGAHPVPQNPAILQAALRAGRRCREEFSYYERRYGERGRRFTDSDAAWLAALTELPEALVASQVLWLGRLLSVRGMPFLLMERQLELLVEELGTLQIPVAALRTVLSDLQSQRCSLIPQSRFDDVCRLVADRITSLGSIGFTDLPFLLIAAFADTLSGIPECMASLKTWLLEQAILTAEEVEEMQDMVCRQLCVVERTALHDSRGMYA